jgi:O-antigen ligase
MFWTEDLSWGFEILHKMWYFLLLLPILFTMAKKEYFNHCTIAFSLAIALTEVFSYLIWFEFIPTFKNASIFNPTPFMSHVSYNPILAFAIYIVMHQVFFKKDLSKVKFFWYSFFSISMSINMFITGGRAGQVMYFVMLSILIFQFFNFEKVKSFFALIIVIPVIFFTAYQASPLFQERVDLSITEVFNYEKTTNSSVGKRLTYAINSLEIIKENPLIGVGTGDFPVEYQKINIANKSNTPNSTNPHNMYTLILVQLGLLGLISMLSIFYYQIKLSFNSSNKFIRDAGTNLHLLFLVVMLSDSYLLGHFTTLMFVFFSAFLYQDSEKTY